MAIRICVKTRCCRKCAKPLTPGTFWGRQTQCKDCQKDYAMMRFHLNTMSVPIDRTCRTCSNSFVASTTFYVNHRVCQSCSGTYKKQWYRQKTSVSARWNASEAFAMRSVEQSLAMAVSERDGVSHLQTMWCRTPARQLLQQQQGSLQEVLHHGCPTKT